MDYANVSGMGDVPVAPPNYYNSPQATGKSSVDWAKILAAMGSSGGNTQGSFNPSMTNPTQFIPNQVMPQSMPQPMTPRRQMPSYGEMINQMLQQQRGF